MIIFVTLSIMFLFIVYSKACFNSILEHDIVLYLLFVIIPICRYIGIQVDHQK